MLKVLQPQEIEAFYLLPALRRELARALKELGKDQKTIAELLGVTGAAVSHYISGKRGTDMELPPTFVKKVRERAKTVKDQASAYAQLQHLVKDANKAKLLCKMHLKMDKNVAPACKLCYQGE
jgi:predicted transcriptional regulator